MIKIRLKLFRITAWFDYEQETDTFENFVIANNENEAKRIVEQEVWSMGGMKIKSIEEIDMTTQQLLCSVNTRYIE